MSTRQEKRKQARKEAKRKAQNEAWDKRLEVKRGLMPVRNDVAMVSILDKVSGRMHIGTRRGAFGGNDEVGITLEPEDLAGCIENQSELAKLVNNLGLMVFAKLTQFDLAGGKPEDWAESVARWAHVDVEALKAADEADQEFRRSATAEVAYAGIDRTVADQTVGDALQAELDNQPDLWRGPTDSPTEVVGLGDYIPDSSVHLECGKGTEDDGPEYPDCGHRNTQDQRACAQAGCGFCQVAEAHLIAEQHSEALSRLAD